MRISAIFAATALTAAVSIGALAQDLVKTRQEAMKGIGGNFRAINQAIQAGTLTPDLAGRAAEMNATAKKVHAFFPAGSAGGAALPAIWEKNADFLAAADRLDKATAALEAALKGGNLDAVKAAAGPVGQSCGGCHNTFRAKT